MFRFFFAFCLAPLALFAQLSAPLSIPLELTGSFCELRGNHYHTGLDFRTQKRTGLPVLSAAAGFVSRIGWKQDGYGRVLYVDHPALGLTTVYGHLEAFDSSIQAYTDSLLVQGCLLELDVVVPAGLLPVEIGQPIGQSGNTGSSTGPHLHFEVRSQKSAWALNPMDYGIQVPDQTPPFFKEIVLVYRPSMEHFEAEQIWHVQALPKGISPPFDPMKDSLKFPRGFWAVLFEAEDRVNRSGFRTDLRQIKLWVDDSLVFSWRVDSLSFEEVRYINAHLRYGKTMEGKRWRRTFRLPNDLASYWGIDLGAGWIYVDDKPRTFKLEIWDDAKNSNALVWKFQALAEPEARALDSNKVASGTTHRLKGDGVEVELSPNLLYQAQRFDLELLESNGPFGFPVWKVGDPNYPVHQDYHIRWDTTLFPAVPKKQLQAMVAYKGRFVPAKETTVQGAHVDVLSNDQGLFTFRIDSIPPKVEWEGARYPKVAFKVVEEGKGIDVLEIRVNGLCLPWKSEMGMAFWTELPPSLEAPYTVCVRGKDKAGNAFSEERVLF